MNHEISVTAPPPVRTQRRRLSGHEYEWIRTNVRAELEARGRWMNSNARILGLLARWTVAIRVNPDDAPMVNLPIERISKEVEYSVRCVKKNLARLEAIGLIRIVQVEGQTTGYVVSLDIVRPNHPVKNWGDDSYDAYWINSIL